MSLERTGVGSEGLLTDEGGEGSTRLVDVRTREDGALAMDIKLRERVDNKVCRRARRVDEDGNLRSSKSCCVCSRIAGGGTLVVQAKKGE